MSNVDRRKQSLYFPDDMLKEIEAEADRQDRSLSWIVQQAWKLAKQQIQSLPSAPTPRTPRTTTSTVAGDRSA